MRRVKSRFGAICLLLLVIVIVTVKLIYTRPTSSSSYVNISPYEKISFEEAERQTGFTIPLPDYVPDGYVLDGIYMYPRTESADTAADVNLPPGPPFEEFQVIFTHDMGVLILRLEGGDTRDEETSARTGGDIPTDFDIQGNMVDVNGTTGVTESGLEKMSIIGAKMHSRLTWRLPCTSTKMPILTGLFLVVESNVLSTSELLEIAKSVRPCIPQTPSLTPSHPTKTPAPIVDSTLLQQALPRYGRLYYRRDGQVWTGFGAPDDRRLVELPFEEIEAVQVVGETLWLLVDGQFAIADLTSGATQTVCEAPRSDVSMALLPLPDRQLAVYAARGDDDHTLGWKSIVGVCDLQTGQTRPLVERPGWVTLLGLTPDGQALYAVPIGGDGGGPIVIIALDDGTIEETDNFVCLLSFAVAPDRSWFAFAEPEAQLTLYDLTDADLSPMTIALPRQPSRADQLVAGRDGRYFYFTLLPGHSGSEPARTYGWWRADVSTGALEQLSPALPVGPDGERLSPVAVSPDGRALLLWGKTGYALLDLQSEAHFLLALPPETQILDWRQP